MQQKREKKANQEYAKNFKPQASKEDKKAKRKQILSSIGGWREGPPAGWQERRLTGCVGSRGGRTGNGGQRHGRVPTAASDYLSSMRCQLHAIRPLALFPPVPHHQARTCWWPLPTSPSASLPPSPVSGGRALQGGLQWR